MQREACVLLKPLFLLSKTSAWGFHSRRGLFERDSTLRKAKAKSIVTHMKLQAKLLHIQRQQAARTGFQVSISFLLLPTPMLR